MTEQPKTYSANLYNSDTSQFGIVEHDADLMGPDMRDKIVESGGTYYRWDQRTGRWIEAEVVSVGAATQPEGGQQAPPAEQAPEQPAEQTSEV